MSRSKTILALAVLAAGSAAHADAVDVSVSGRALKGEGFPYVEVRINEPIAGFELKLTRDGGETLHKKGGGKPGVTRRIELIHPEGRAHWKGTLEVVFPDSSTGEMPLEFETELQGPLKLSIDKKDIDLDARKVTFRLSREAAKAEVLVLMDTGELAIDDEVLFNKEPAGTPLSVSWPAREGRVLKISIRAFDPSSFYTGVEIYPWQIEIPHEEVLFKSGKADVQKSEAKKLDESLKLIVEAVNKYGRYANVRLYIAGHTDSVGATLANRTLSLNRAKAIGLWFKKRGLRIPIYYEGFGEQSLRVATPDETDEPSNRRAEYIISIEDPTIQNTPFQPSWRKL